MTIVPATRVNYFERQFIRLAEVRDEQDYHITLRRRHNITHHSWGIVLGLELVLEDGRPVVRPGLAIDGYGRELLLVDRQPFGREVFDRLGTSRLDLWLEYRLEYSDDRLAPIECGNEDPRRRYRATEGAQVEFERAPAARVAARQPRAVPSEDLEESRLPATPDDPRCKWPVYLGRVFMEIDKSGQATFDLELGDRVYAGLVAELIDHPGNATRVEIGHRPPQPDYRTIGDDTYEYAPGADRDFAVFVPPPPRSPADAQPTNAIEHLEPTLSVTGQLTEILGSAEVHGNLVLDGSSLVFNGGVVDEVDPGSDPTIYRSRDELRIDLGNLQQSVPRLVIGVTKDDKFHPCIQVEFPLEPNSSTLQPLVTVLGDLRIEGLIDCDDVRARTVTPEVAAMLGAMVQAGMAAGGT